MVHRPQCLDTACSLALLQEEALLDFSREHKKWDHLKKFSGDSYKHHGTSKTATGFTPRQQAPNVDQRKQNDSLKLKPPDDKLSSLKSYRRSKGLCFKCGEKWSPGHKCPPIVSLQVMEEVWQYLNTDRAEHSGVDSDDPDSGDDLMAISLQAIRGTEGSQTIRF